MWRIVQFLTLVQVATVHHIRLSEGIHIAPKIILQALRMLRYLEMATPSDRWAINMKGKIITLGDSTINEIHRDLTMIMGRYETESMEAWMNIFPLN